MAILKNQPGNINAKLPYAQQQLGVDLRLTDSGDLEINNLNDISLIAGIENVAQAVYLKLNVEPLGNRYHPEIGVNLPIGDKTTDATQLRMEILSSLRQDNRLQDVTVKVQVSGSVYLVDIQVKVLSQTLSVPLQFIAGT